MSTAKPTAGVPDPAQVARTIRDLILGGEYGPQRRLVEAEICAELNVSRFVVRAALQTLAKDGIVEIQRNKGARVRQISIDEAIEINEIRTVVEGLTSALAAERISASHVSELEEVGILMQRAASVGELVRYSELDNRLHGLIRDIANHETSSRILEHLGGQIVRHKFALLFQPGRMAVSLPQHQRIISAIIRRDAAEAERVTREHFADGTAMLRKMRSSSGLALSIPLSR